MKTFSLIGIIALFFLSPVFAQTDYRAVGEQWMEQMMGPAGHEASDKAMEEQMGKQFVEQMHEAMGKSLSSREGYTMMPMMNVNSWDSLGWLGVVLASLFWLGILLLVWLGVIKLWQSIRK